MFIKVSFVRFWKALSEVESFNIREKFLRLNFDNHQYLPFFCFFLFFSILAPNGYNQNYLLKSYNLENGFPNDLVKSIATDTLGFVWAATDEGLVRYNGKKFTLYNQGLPSKYFKSVFCSRNGELFASCDMGILEISYTATKVSFNLLLEGSVQPADGKTWYPKQFFGDSRGNTWLSDNRNIFRITDKQIKTYKPGEIGLSNNYQRSFSFFENEDSKLFAISQTGIIFIYNEATDQFITFKENRLNRNVNAVLYAGNQKILAAHPDFVSEIDLYENGKVKSVKTINNSPDIACFYQTLSGKVFSGSWSSGLYLIIHENNQIRFERVPDYTSGGAVNQIIEYHNAFWCATDNGINLLKPMFFSRDLTRFASQYIQNVVSDSTRVYFTDGQHIFMTDQRTKVTKRIYSSAGRLILRLLPDEAGLWITDNLGQISLLDKGKPVKTINLRQYGTSIHFITIDEAKNLWICQDGREGILKIDRSGNIQILDKSTGLDALISVIRPLKNGKLLLGGTSPENYLYSFDPTSGNLKNESVTLPFEHNIPINVNDIAEISTGGILLATSHGLLKMINGKIARLDIGEFTEHDIKAVTIDNHGNYWFAVSRGIVKYKNGEFFLFDNSDGLPSKTITYRSIFADNLNQIWAGTLSGVTCSENLEGADETPLPLIISIKVNNTEIDPDYKPVIRTSDFIQFDFVSSVYPSEHIEYEYRVIGKDSVWKRCPSNEPLLVSGFKNQSYEFMVRARQKGNHSWSRPASYSYTVSEYLYLRWWAILIYFSAIISITYLIILFRGRKLERERNLLNKMVSERTYELEVKTREIEVKNQELEKAKVLAEQSAKAKADFLSTMSHEMRTPLHGVIGMANYLLMDNPREDQHDKLNILRFSAENLLLLISDVLDFSKIDAGKIELEELPFDLHQLLNDLWLSMKIPAQEKNISLILDLHEKVPVHILGDKIKLAQILNNLVANAIKFTGTGHVKLSVTPVDSEMAAGSFKFMVEDTGIGIPEDKRDHIFEAFSQATSDISRKYGGTGLGLAIISRLLSLMGSRIEFDSIPGVGSQFWFVLKLKKSEPLRGSEPQSIWAEKYQSLHGIRVLLVEDNKVNIKIARQFMEKWGISVDVAETGEQAFQQTRQNKYHLILMDLHLPDKDGFEITAEIRKSDNHTPIIALTADAQIEIREIALKSGMNDLITKPFKPQDLYLKIVRYALPSK